METGHFIGIVIALSVLIGVGVYSVNKVKNAADFDTGGGKGSIFMVSGLLLGSLIGGQCTIGTAQLSYTYGLSAVWFTVGAGLGALVLCLIYVAPLRRRRDVTLLEVIRKEYGETAEYMGSILCSIGILVSIISNVVASSALMMALTGLQLWSAAILSVLLMCCYVVFGGAWGAEMGGIVKVALLLLTSAVCVILCFVKSGGPVAMGGTLELHLSDLFSRGVGRDLSNCMSAILGVLSTQTYAQAVWSAKNYHVAKKAALISCLICIPVGFTGMVVGLFMRGTDLSNPAEAFPVFLLENLPPVLGGIGLGALLITVVTGGGGLALGVSTIFIRDIAGRLAPSLHHGKAHIISMRLCILGVLSFAGLVAVMIPGALINDLGFLSMGLRGTVVFIPLTLALFCKGRFRRGPVLASMVCGPAVMLFSNLVWSPVDPLLGSVALCLFICMFGYKTGEVEKL